MGTVNGINNQIPDNDFTVINLDNGGNAQIALSNTSNTAGSNAAVLATVAGSSAGDAFTQYSVFALQAWSVGVDNSDSDSFAIAASSTLGTSNVMRASTAGAVSFTLGNVDVTKSSSGADVALTISNTSNTASSTASEYITVAGGTASDARTQYAVSGVTTWTIGIDNSASDAFVLAASTALGTTNVMSASTAGQVNWPLQPAFLATLNSQVTNVTGNGTVFQLGNTTPLTERYDQGSNFNTNGTFTAPVTGRYFLGAWAYIDGCTIGIGGRINIVTSNLTYLGSNSSRDPSAQTSGATGTVLADMDAADTCVFQVVGFGEAGATNDVGLGIPGDTGVYGNLSV